LLGGVPSDLNLLPFVQHHALGKQFSTAARGAYGQQYLNHETQSHSVGTQKRIQPLTVRFSMCALVQPRSNDVHGQRLEKN
jgi:hypothetical protein